MALVSFKLRQVLWVVLGLSLLSAIAGGTTLVVVSPEIMNVADEQIVALKQKAKAGDAEAQNKLGERYASGEGVRKNDAKAVKWYRKAADQGYAAGQNNLGDMYQKGHSVPQNYLEAMKWYRKAADQGHAVAQANLADIYYDGRMGVIDLTTAAQLYFKSAKQGYAPAQANLGKMYDKGEEVTPDPLIAYHWLDQAA